MSSNNTETGSLYDDRIFEDLFDAAHAPWLTRTAVPGITPTAPQIEEAEQKLASRRRQSHWQKLAQNDLDQIYDIVERQRKVVSDEWQGAQSELMQQASKIMPEDRRKALFQTRTSEPMRAINAKLFECAEFARISGIVAAGRNAASRCFSRKLPFYPSGQLIHIETAPGLPSYRLITIRRPYKNVSNPISPLKDNSEIIFLDGTAGPINSLNARLYQSGALDISSDTVEEYNDFFCAHVHGPGGPFAIVEHKEALPGDDARLVLRTPDQQRDGLIAKIAQPIILLAPDLVLNEAQQKPVGSGDQNTTNIYYVLATVVYSRQVFRSLFSIWSTGKTEMLKDEPLDGFEVDLNPPPWWGPGRLKDGTDFQNESVTERANDADDS